MNLLKLGPTSANCSPARFLFLRTADAKGRLRGALSAGNVERALSAPVIAIVAHDPRFYEEAAAALPRGGCPGLVCGERRIVHRDGVPERDVAGRLSHRGGASFGAGLRAHVGVRQ